MKLTRRVFIGTALAGPAALSSPAILTRALAQEKRKISFTLPFLAEGGSTYVYVAKAMGYWDELGLDVSISRGYGSIAAAQAIANGQFDFGLAVPSAAIQQAAKGLNIVSIACAGYDATTGVCVLDSSHIHAPKGLEGKKMASVVASGEYPFLPAFAKRAGFDLKSVDIIQIDPNVRQKLLTSGQVDAISGFAISFIPPLVSQGYQARSMLFSDYGMVLYNNALLTQPSKLKGEPRLCADMTAGLLKGIKYVLLEPEKSVDLFLKEVPEAALTKGGAERIRLGLGIFSVSMLFEPSLKKGLGYSLAADYDEMIDLVMKYVADNGDKAPRVAELMTNEFVGKITLSADEWNKAKANAEPFRKYLTARAG